MAGEAAKVAVELNGRERDIMERLGISDIGKAAMGSGERVSIGA